MERILFEGIDLCVNKGDEAYMCHRVREIRRDQGLMTENSSRNDLCHDGRSGEHLTLIKEYTSRVGMSFRV